MAPGFDVLVSVNQHQLNGSAPGRTVGPQAFCLFGHDRERIEEVLLGHVQVELASAGRCATHSLHAEEVVGKGDRGASLVKSAYQVLGKLSVLVAAHPSMLAQ